MSAGGVDDRIEAALLGIQRGSETAAAELYDLVAGWVYHVSLGITGRQASAKKATVATFVHLWRRGSRPTESNLPACVWVLQVAASCARQQRSSDLVPSSSNQPRTSAVLMSDPESGQLMSIADYANGTSQAEPESTYSTAPDFRVRPAVRGKPRHRGILLARRRGALPPR